MLILLGFFAWILIIWFFWVLIFYLFNCYRVIKRYLFIFCFYCLCTFRFLSVLNELGACILFYLIVFKVLFHEIFAFNLTLIDLVIRNKIFLLIKTFWKRGLFFLFFKFNFIFIQLNKFFNRRFFDLNLRFRFSWRFNRIKILFFIDFLLSHVRW
jgi:hypothetical protein